MFASGTRLRGFQIIWVLVAALLLFLPDIARPEEFPIFDGRVYNGKFYPRVDVIEWGTPSTMEFHVYSKDKPVELSFELEKSRNKKVILVNYHLADRGEHQCRRVIAPGHFSEGFLVYKDTSDSDFDNIIVSMQPLPKKSGLTLLSEVPKYASCEMEDPDRVPAGEKKAKKPESTRATSGAVKGKDGAAPFSDW